MSHRASIAKVGVARRTLLIVTLVAACGSRAAEPSAREPVPDPAPVGEAAGPASSAAPSSPTPNPVQQEAEADGSATKTGEGAKPDKDAGTKTAKDSGSKSSQAPGKKADGGSGLCGGKACSDPRTCVRYYGIAGPAGPQFESCELLCGAEARNPTCPEGMRCALIADGPGHVCRPSGSNSGH